MYRLTDNMRVKNISSNDQGFSKWLLDLGEGALKTYPEIGQDFVEIPQNLKSKSDSLDTFCDEIFPNLKSKVQEGMSNR